MERHGAGRSDSMGTLHAHATQDRGYLAFEQWQVLLHCLPDHGCVHAEVLAKEPEYRSQESGDRTHGHLS